MDNHEIQPYIPQPIAIPPGMTVAYTAQGQPVYIPQQQAMPQPVYVQPPSQALPDWLRNFLILGVGLIILCVPAVTVLLVVAPAVMAMRMPILAAEAGRHGAWPVETIAAASEKAAAVAEGQALAYSGIGIGIGVIGVAAAIKSLRETPAAPRKK